MASQFESFPYRDLSEAEASTIAEMWDYNPVVNRPKVKFFQEIGGKPLLMADSQLSHFMNLLMVSTAETLGIESETAHRAFAGGALFYAGVYQYFTQARRLPLDTHALTAIANLDGPVFTLRSREDIQERTPNFFDLLERTMPALTPKRDLAEVVQIGAGTLQLVVTESEKQAHSIAVLEEWFEEPLPGNSLAAYENDPELNDLRSLFNQLAE